MATTVSVILAGLGKTVRMTLMSVTQALVATLAPVWTPSMDSIASVHLVLQVGSSFWPLHGGGTSLPYSLSPAYGSYLVVIVYAFLYCIIIIITISTD
jgi:hypothetical protein